MSKKVDKRATVRNRLKRQIREIFRLSRPFLTQPIDLLIIARQSAKDCDYKEIHRQIVGTLRHHKLLDKLLDKQLDKQLDNPPSP